jgi:hypothetical protein
MTSPGGFRSFEDTPANGKVAPKAALHEIRDQTAGFEPWRTLGPRIYSGSLAAAAE